MDIEEEVIESLEIVVVIMDNYINSLGKIVTNLTNKGR